MSETVEKHSSEHNLESRRGRLARFFGERATRETYTEPQVDLRELMEELPNHIEMGGDLAQQLEVAMRQNTAIYRGDEVHNFRIDEDEVAKTVYFRLSEAGREIGADLPDWTVSLPVDSFVGAPWLG